ncbi:MAG TPA: EAL domain-containing protein [Gammaproteobacteria bacterium]|nr:EAL domain-containing protein [Gammaproteobacteria bacterium]
MTPDSAHRGTAGLESQVALETTAHLYAYTRGVPLLTLALIAAAAALRRDAIELPVLVTLLAYVTSIEVGRSILHHAFERTIILPATVHRWRLAFEVGATLSGAGLGAAVIVLVPHDAEIYLFLLAFVCAALSALAIPILAPGYRAYLLFSAGMNLPAIAHLAFGHGGRAGFATATLCALAAVVCAVLARRMSTEIRDAVRNKITYAGILEEYDEAVTTRLKAEDTLRKGEQRGRRQNYLLLDLAKEESISNGDLPAAMSAIATRAADAIRCARVSIWFCEPDFSEFRCVYILDGSTHDRAPGIAIRVGQNAKYYRRLERLRTFAIGNVASDPRTADFLEYFQRFHITAVLGAPFRYEGRVRGFIMQEHIGMPRQWTRDERAFASSLADFLSLAHTAAGRQKAQEQLRQMANFDRLTGLPNRAMFLDRMRHALEKAKRANNELAVLFVDVDRFKSINDSLGHHTGDRVLRAIAKRLVRCVRSADTVARLGGDEFTVILEDVDVPTITAVTERILSTVSEPLVLDDNELALSCSIGISVYPADGDEVDKLVQNADTAMYGVKERGRNGYKFFTEDMHARAMQRLARESQLRKSVVRGEFTLQYQPFVDVRNGSVHGVEALVRWRHPDGRLVEPAEFISLAEESGLIGSIGEWVLREACRQMREWRATLGPDFYVAVNLSPGQFRMRNIPELVSDVLRVNALPPEALVLEVTESLAIADAATNSRLLRQIKEMGVRIALDDFGTGSSSLSYLKRFPVDILKIDRSFVRDLGEDRHDTAIARATIALAHSLDLDVIAEGVETERQRDWLKAERCYFMQGYLFSPPREASDCEAWLRASLTTPVRSSPQSPRRRRQPAT